MLHNLPTWVPYVLFLVGLALGCYALAENTPCVEDDQFTPEQPFPGPLHESERERALREAYVKRREEARIAWGTKMEVERLIAEVEEGA